MHKLAVSAAALAVCVLPTACNVPMASPPGAPSGSIGGHSGHDDLATTAPVVVPVGNTSEAEAAPATEAQAEAQSARSANDGDRDRDRDRRRTRTRTPRPTTSTETAAPVGNGTETTTPTDTSVPATDTTTTAPPTSTPPPVNNGLDLLGRTCAEGTNAGLDPHTGFQADAAQCVSTQMGAVAESDKLPSLLITEAPATVAVGQPILLTVSTRNLVRDRFLGAAAGGYYLEASFLNGDGLQRGHFHTACRILSTNPNTPPDEAPVAARNDLFVATQDGGGNAAPDSVTVEIVPAAKNTQEGIMQCASWAGDGSHRTPMMSFANQIPAFDSVRINVGGSAPALPEAPAAGAAAEAEADAQQQAEGQQQQAGQAPDQDGSSGGGGAPAPAPAPADPAAPASPDTAAPATSTSAATAAPASRRSLQDRFRELRERRQAQGG
jgi:hypothetical protein